MRNKILFFLFLKRNIGFGYSKLMFHKFSLKSFDYLNMVVESVFLSEKYVNCRNDFVYDHQAPGYKTFFHTHLS